MLISNMIHLDLTDPGKYIDQPKLLRFSYLDTDGRNRGKKMLSGWARKASKKALWYLLILVSVSLLTSWTEPKQNSVSKY